MTTPFPTRRSSDLVDGDLDVGGGLGGELLHGLVRADGGGCGRDVGECPGEGLDGLAHRCAAVDPHLGGVVRHVLHDATLDVDQAVDGPARQVTGEASPLDVGGVEHPLEQVAAGHLGDPQASEPVELLRSEEHTSELQPLMRNSYAVFCLKKKNTTPSQVLIPPYETSQSSSLSLIPYE